ncbi:MAG: hypothetical protein ASARMPREDX12_006419 [Alectoria sarmentosa]|nr:MAG: hypothetical protein ASARMPREDX12_006419 [Alectoria sarmentosa]
MSGKYTNRQELPHHTRRDYASESQRSPGSGSGGDLPLSAGTTQGSSHPRDLARDEVIIAQDKAMSRTSFQAGRNLRDTSSDGNQRPQNASFNDTRSPRGGVSSNGHTTRKDASTGSPKVPNDSIPSLKQGARDGRPAGPSGSGKKPPEYARDVGGAAKLRRGSESETLVGAASPKRSRTGDQIAKKEPSITSELADLKRAPKEFSPTPSPQFSQSGVRNNVRTNFLLKMNNECSPVYPAIAVIELMKQFGVSRVQPLEKFLKNIRIQTTYLKTETGEPKPNILRIKGFGRMRDPEVDEKGAQKVEDQKLKWKGEADANPGNATDLKFLRGPGEMISVKEYFVEKGIELKHPKSWVLQCGSKNKDIWIPAELAAVIPGQRFCGQLTEEQAEGVKAASRLSVEDAKRFVDKEGRLGVVGVLAERGSSVGSQTIQIVPDTFTVPGIIACGRLLPVPAVIYENTGAQPGNALWNMKDKRMCKTAPSSLAWTILKLGGATVPEGRETIIRSALKSYGLKMQEPSFGPSFCSIKSRGSAFEKELKTFFEDSAGEKIKLMLVVLPKKNDRYYAKVKYCGDFIHGIQTICIQSSQLESFNSATAPFYADIARKYNLKAGGINHLLHDSSMLRAPSGGKVMYAGIDVAHSRTDGKDRKAAAYSITSVVANVDTEFGQWPGSVRYQFGNEETVKDLEIMMEERLSLFGKHSGNPANVVDYRGGVSDGKHQTVLAEEFPMIAKACDKVCKTRPKITIIMVGQGHQKRFYPLDRATAAPRHQHISKPGTLVDNCKEGNRGWEFFLQTHFVAKSSKEDASPAAAAAKPAKPAHYLVVNDEARYEAKTLEETTNCLCYLFGRSTAPTSVCLPVYYADLLCRRGRCLREVSLAWNAGTDEKSGKEARRLWEGGVHKELKDSMFYI